MSFLDKIKDVTYIRQQSWTIPPKRK